jgi:hypothetical protein
MESFSALAKSTPQSVHLWHRRLGHVAVSTIKKMADNLMADGLVLSEDLKKDIVCEGCIYGKHHRLPFPTSGRTRGKKIGDLIHSDVCGPVSVPSSGGAKYFVTFRDDYSSSQVSQFSSSPTKAHWDAVKRIFSYLKETLNYGITFGDSDSRNELLAYTDADFASNQDDRRSTTGVILLLNRGAMSWKSQRQKCVSLSTTESEYVAAATAAKEVVWMRRLLQDLRLPQSAPTTLFCDNQSSIKLVKNAEFHQRTKHIDVKFHFIRALQEEQVIDVTYINIDVQLADILTKALNGPRFTKLREEINITVHVC